MTATATATATEIATAPGTVPMTVIKGAADPLAGVHHVVDVSHLPTSAFGSRDSHFWGIVCLMAIEGTMFALLIASYFYLRGNEALWPPRRMPDAALTLGAASVALLLLSCVPTHIANRSTATSNLRGMRAGILGALLVGLVFIGVRFAEFASLGFTWGANAYGSVVWMMLGLHTVHGIAGVVENFIMLALLFHRPLEEKHLVDIRVGGLYWYFVAVLSVAIGAVLYLEPLLFGSPASVPTILH